MNNLSILVVEDEIDLLERLAKYLSIFCDTIYKAKDGLEALEMYKEYQPTLILTDINMPRLSGVEFVQEVRKTDATTQIIILSAHTNTEDFLAVVPLGLVDYLVKPIQTEQLKTAILKAFENIAENKYVTLADDYVWNKLTNHLELEGEVISLTMNESSFVEMLVSKIDEDVSYEEIHNHIYNLAVYSQNAIFTLVKRIRQKTTKDLIKSCFKFGYTIESRV